MGLLFLSVNCQTKPLILILIIVILLKMAKTKLSVNIIARNGSEDLKELIPLVKEAADEIIVILDSRTTDDTKAVCLALGAKVIDHEWGDAGFAGARNKAIENSTGDYIAWFDCDDRPVTPQALVDFKKSNKDFKTIYTFQVRNVPGTTVFNQVRMFPRHEKVRFVYRIHETITHEVCNFGFGISNFELIVDHHGYKHNDKYKDKLTRNLPYIEEEIKSGSFCPTLRYTYSMNLISLGYNDQAEYWLKKNITDEVKDSPFRDVYIFSILNVAKILINKKCPSEAEHYITKGMLTLPDFKEYHLLRAHISYSHGDLVVARLAINNAVQCPERNYAIATDWPLVNQQVEQLRKALA